MNRRPKSVEQGPSVFISYAGPDVGQARRLRQDLHQRGIGGFVYEDDLPAGLIIWHTISEQIEASDYFVLLWSGHVPGRQPIAIEWSAAMQRELDQSFTFLFVFRLDDSPMPVLLKARRALAAWEDWDRAVEILTADWNEDTNVRPKPIIPAPWQELEGGTDTVRLIVSNGELAFSHLLYVPPRTTASRLHAAITSGLNLPEVVWQLEDELGLAFEYQIHLDGVELRPGDRAVVNIADNSTADLVISVTTKVGDRAQQHETYRSGLSDSQEVELIRKALGHLTPPPRRRHNGNR